MDEGFRAEVIERIIDGEGLRDYFQDVEPSIDEALGNTLDQLWAQPVSPTLDEVCTALHENGIAYGPYSIIGAVHIATNAR